MSLLFLLLCVVVVGVSAQQGSPLPSSSSSSRSSPSPSISLSLTTGSATVTIATTVNNQPTQIVTVLPGIVSNVTYTLLASSQPSITSSPSPTPTPDPYALDTVLDPAFAVLGVILILTGLPSAFWGHKNRWTSFFLIGFYTFSLVCIVLIFKFGVIPAVHPPTNMVRGMFVLSSVVAGIAGGAIAIFFWKAARYGIGAWGGFAFALWVQCFRNGGLIRPIGFRWILYIGCGVLGFTLVTIPKIHYHVLLISTAIVGASSFILGVDCFTTAGLKEFYVWNLGFPAIFPKYDDNGIQFPVTQQMEIELGLIGAVALMGAAVQLRILRVLQQKVHEIAEETKHFDEEAEVKAAERLSNIHGERDLWEKEHPSLGKHGRNESNLSSMPLLNRHESISPPSEEQSDGQRDVSGLSDFRAAPTSDEDLRRASRHSQAPGVLPALELGLGIKEEVPSNYIAKDIQLTAAELEDFKRKQELLAEIQNLRRSIDVLKSETPAPSSSGQSRHPSLTSRRTYSMDAGTALMSNVAGRPPDLRARVHSLELASLTAPLREPISRPTSVPLRDDNWERYVIERKLLQPPSGITPPIGTSALPSSRGAVSPAVQEALQRRKRRESILAGSSESSEDVPLVRFAQQQQQKANNGQVTILPPRRASVTIVAAEPQSAARTRTFEELNERHREKLRDLQAPLTRAEKEHAELDAARRRWERAKVLEKEAVTRRQAEKVAALEKRKKTEPPEANTEHAVRGSHESRRHSRTLSADVLGNPGTSGPTHSRRLSVMKVEDWQRYQQETDVSGVAQGGSKRDSRRSVEGKGVPFPHEPVGRHKRQKSRDMLG